ncbi:MAG TPA: ribosome silencing factor [Burkholderiaceae bacterium]|nr:ribosome silencing factor [Burkholderiaceae bacterium]
MDIRKLQRAIVDGLEDVKAQDIVVFNTEHLSPLFERVIIASGTSNRQTKALASSVRETVKKRGLQVMATEGEDNGEWIIVDCGAAVAHIMQPAIREYYHLEEIWGGKPVKMRMDGGPRGLPKAAEEPPHASPTEATAAGKAAVKKGAATKTSTRAQAGKASAKKAVVKKAVVKKAAAKKTVPGKAAGASARTPARKSPARKTTSATGGKKAVVTRTVGTRSAAGALGGGKAGGKAGAKAGAKSTASRKPARKSAAARR